MKLRVPLLLSLVAGYVDAAGFLALQGLFTAHVTGNFVTAGAALVYGTSGVVPKLLAIPVFGAIVALVRVSESTWLGDEQRHFRQLLVVEFILLLAGGTLAIHFGPFPDGDTGPALVTGMLLVCAMAVQNALNRLHLASFPPTTMMTGNATQVVLDLVDVLCPPKDDAKRRATRTRFLRTAGALAAFGIGCASAALLVSKAGMGCFAVPPLLVLVVILIEPLGKSGD